MDKTCSRCGQSFITRPQNREFLDEISPVFAGKKYLVPDPSECPFCRMQHRLSYRNERFLYHRKCDLTGRQIISSFSIDKPFPVYDNDAWWSDDWNPLDYGQEYDFSKSFFEQFFALRDRVPRIGRQQQKPMENSDYCNCASHNRNCYLVFSTNECEDCYYGSWVNQCKDCLDTLNVEHCELCYECVSCRDCYGVLYCRDCLNCRSSYFLRDCQGCQNCFGCSNQINKQFMVFNEQKTEAEYHGFVSGVNTGSYNEMNAAQQRIDHLLQDHIVKEYHGTNIENSSGDYLRNCKNAHLCFECDHCEDVTYCQCIQNSKNCMDQSHWGQNCEWVYYSHACGYDNLRLLFCNVCWEGCSDLFHCDLCFSSSNCFGCVSLKKNRYCILNRQYSKEEYENLLPRIIEQMQAGEEWGLFMPYARSVYAYNETLAQEQVSLTKETAIGQGFLWKDDAGTQQDKYLGPVIAVPDSIDQVKDDICNQIILCEVTKKPFKIIPQELAFYKRMNIPIPRLCPDERHRCRLKLRNPRYLWNRTCAKCGKDIETSYHPDRKEVVYCESCYLATVY